jgi:hypothetical protein
MRSDSRLAVLARAIAVAELLLRRSVLLAACCFLAISWVALLDGAPFFPGLLAHYRMDLPSRKMGAAAGLGVADFIEKLTNQA